MKEAAMNLLQLTLIPPGPNEEAWTASTKSVHIHYIYIYKYSIYIYIIEQSEHIYI